MMHTHSNHRGRLTGAEAYKRQRVTHLASGVAVVRGAAQAELAVPVVPSMSAL